MERRYEVQHPKTAAMLGAPAKTGNISASARAADIHRSCHYKWLESDPEYAAAVEAALEEPIEVLEAVARQRAVHGSDTLLIFLLKSLRPERYRERYDIRQQGQRQVEEVREVKVTFVDTGVNRGLVPRRELPGPEDSN